MMIIIFLQIKGSGLIKGHYITNLNNALLQGKSLKITTYLHQIGSPQNGSNLMIFVGSMEKEPLACKRKHLIPTLGNFTSLRIFFSESFDENSQRESEKQPLTKPRNPLKNHQKNPVEIDNN